MRALTCTLLLCAWAGCGVRASAQTVQPAVVEIQMGKQAWVDGHFEVSNNTLEPMIVTVEAKSFDIRRDGIAVFRPLAPEVHLDLSVTSLRLWPKQHRTVFYRINASAYPAWLCIYSNFFSAVRHGGVQVQLEMPHTVYLLDHSKAGVEMVRFAELHRLGDRVQGTIQNRSGTLVRVATLEVAGAHGKAEMGGFPLLPGAVHEFEIAAPSGPVRLRAQTASFHVDTEVQ